MGVETREHMSEEEEYRQKLQGEEPWKKGLDG